MSQLWLNIHIYSYLNFHILMQVLNRNIYNPFLFNTPLCTPLCPPPCPRISSLYLSIYVYQSAHGSAALKFLSLFARKYVQIHFLVRTSGEKGKILKRWNIKFCPHWETFQPHVQAKTWQAQKTGRILLSFNTTLSPFIFYIKNFIIKKLFHWQKLVIFPLTEKLVGL